MAPVLVGSPPAPTCGQEGHAAGDAGVGAVAGMRRLRTVSEAGWGLARPLERWGQELLRFALRWRESVSCQVLNVVARNQGWLPMIFERDIYKFVPSNFNTWYKL